MTLGHEKPMKKIKIPVLLCCALILGCTRQNTLTFIVGGTSNDFAFWEKTIAAFTRKTGVPVELIRSATQTELRRQQIFIALRGKKPDPDIMVMDIAWIGQLAASDWLEPLETYDIDTSIFFHNIVALADVHAGHIIGLPLYVDAGLLYYRKDLLEKYGYAQPPETWQQLKDMAVRIQKKERKSNPDFWGYVWQGAQYEGLVCNALEMFTSAGGGFFSDTNKPVIDQDGNIHALQYMTDIINKERISPPNTYTDMKEEEVRLLFHNGNALFQRNWPYAGKLHDEEGSAVRGKYGTAMLPHFPAGKSVATLGGWHIGISKYSDCKESAAAFLRFISSHEVQKGLAIELGHNPGREDVYASDELQSGYLGRLKEVLLTAVPRPVVPYYSQVSLILQKYINTAITGAMKPDEALHKAQNEIEKIVAAYEK